MEKNSEEREGFVAARQIPADPQMVDGWSSI